TRQVRAPWQRAPVGIGGERAEEERFWLALDHAAALLREEREHRGLEPPLALLVALEDELRVGHHEARLRARRARHAAAQALPGLALLRGCEEDRVADRERAEQRPEPRLVDARQHEVRHGRALRFLRSHRPTTSTHTETSCEVESLPPNQTPRTSSPRKTSIVKRHTAYWISISAAGTPRLRRCSSQNQPASAIRSAFRLIHGCVAHSTFPARSLLNRLSEFWLSQSSVGTRIVSGPISPPFARWTGRQLSSHAGGTTRP